MTTKTGPSKTGLSKTGLLARALRGLRRAHRGEDDGRLEDGDDSEGGAALVEFAVVFPAQLFVTLALMQLSLMIVGHILVGHAAWAAARAAVVRDVPLSSGGPSGRQAQTEAARDAAALILAPISPPDAELDSTVTVTNAPTSELPANLDNKLKYPSQGKDGSFDISRKKGAYSLATIELEPGDVTGQDVYCVRVRFQFPLVIPVVNRWFASGAEYLLYGVAPGTQVPGIVGTDYPTLSITKTGFVPCPWSKQP